MNTEELKQYIDKMGTAFEEFKDNNDDRIKAIESGDETKAGELENKLEKIEKDVSKFSDLKRKLEREHEAMQERIEELESLEGQPKTAEQKIQDEYADAFTDWIRHRGHSANLEEKLHTLEKKSFEAKEINIGGSGSAGGFAVPERIAREIERQEKLFSPVRRLVKVVSTSTSDYKELVNVRGVSSGWVGEQGSRSETNTSEFREVTPTHGELYAYPQVSEWAADDVFFNVENFLSQEIGQQFAIEEGEAVINGNGTNKPTGMLNSAPTAVADFGSPLRSAAEYQFVESSASPSAVTADSLIDLVYELNSMYRVNATFVMNSNTTAAVRKLKDNDDQYLWQPGLQQGQPSMLLGYPIETWEQLDDVDTNNHPIGFGDFMRGYLLTDRVGMRITRDQVTNPGFIRFYTRRREGGIVLNNNAVKFLKTT